MRGLRRILETGWRLMDAVTALFMLAMIAIVFANVVLRYGFASGILGSVEISRFLFVWIVMLGAIACLRRGEHLTLHLVTDLLPRRVAALLGRLAQAVVLLSCLLLLLGSLRQTLANWSNIQPMSGLPVGAVYLAGAVGGALMAAVAAVALLLGPGPGEAERREGEEGA